MSHVIGYIGSVAVVLLLIGGIYAMSSSAYGDWVREFYAKRDRLQGLFGNDKKKNKLTCRRMNFACADDSLRPASDQRLSALISG